MSDFDHEHVSHLLNIVGQCAEHPGKLGSLSSAAMNELLELNAKIKEQESVRQKQAEADKAKDAAIKAKEAGKDAARADAQRQAEVDRGRGQRQAVIPEGQPATIDPDYEATDPGAVRPSSWPSDSNTATIADANIDRRV
jgi:hypothetical protein